MDLLEGIRRLNESKRGRPGGACEGEGGGFRFGKEVGERLRLRRRLEGLGKAIRERLPRGGAAGSGLAGSGKSGMLQQCGARGVLRIRGGEARRERKKRRRPTSDAICGAAAGCLVTIFLHPIDTIKVLVQSELSIGVSRNLSAILRNLVTTAGGPQRLYYGLGANLASSMPISAIYTSTYEASKMGLVRFTGEAEGRSWIRHCLAGACASVATSFVYTPSECVKNRVQAGLYTKSWTALFHIIKTEGPLNLYRAWPAVVLRNVPQSIVKFFAYEQLKVLVKRYRGREATTPEMLLIGGLAGASGALFSTPFDVIKTRMQTQVGRQAQMSLRRTMADLVAREGFVGLYRGLAPRLLIYLSQGAIFFSAYEALRSGIRVDRDGD